MSTEQLALVRGWDDTRATLRRWRARPLPAIRPWALGSLAIAAVLLTATWVVAMVSMPDPTVFAPTGNGEWGDYGFILYRNGLVLSLHAMACVAGFMAGASLPLAAEGYSGWWRSAHDRAGKLAMGFVAAATLFSLSTQAYALGLQASQRRRRPRRQPGAADGLPAPPRGAGAGRAVPPARRLAAGEPPEGLGRAARRHVRHDGDRGTRPPGRRGGRGLGLTRTYYPF